MNILLLQHKGITRANMVRINGEYLTEVFVDGIKMKTIPTPASQIRYETKSHIWCKDDGVDFNDIEEENERRTTYMKDIDASGKKGLHSKGGKRHKIQPASINWNHKGY